MTERLQRLGLRIAQLTFLVGIASCAAPTKPLPPEAARQLHKLALLDVPEPGGYPATNMYLEGVFLGGIVNMQHAKQFSQAMRDTGFSVSPPFTECLVRALTSAGFEVEQVGATRKRSQPGIELRSKTDADALLNVSIAGSYVSAHGVDDYVPAFSARAELLENKTGQQGQLYSERYWYGYYNPLIGGIQIEATQTYRYGSFDTLMQSTVQAGEGLREGAMLVCERLVKDIAAKWQ
jgi:hypothetical protein